MVVVRLAGAGSIDGAELTAGAARLASGGVSTRVSLRVTPGAWHQEHAFSSGLQPRQQPKCSVPSCRAGSSEEVTGLLDVNGGQTNRLNS
eukprot:337770-Prymnesium_polylepis.1